MFTSKFSAYKLSRIIESEVSSRQLASALLPKFVELNCSNCEINNVVYGRRCTYLGIPAIKSVGAGVQLLRDCNPRYMGYNYIDL